MVEPEVVHRIAIHGIELHFLAIEEGGLGRDRAWRDHMAIGEDQSALRIDHEAGGLSTGVAFGV